MTQLEWLAIAAAGRAGKQGGHHLVSVFLPSECLLELVAELPLQGLPLELHDLGRRERMDVATQTHIESTTRTVALDTIVLVFQGY